MQTHHNIDSRAMPQRVHIRWEMVLIPDNDMTSPDARQDGFWPSRHKSNPGYVPAGEFEAAQAAARARMDGWRNGDWHYVGVVARATVSIPIGGNSFRILTLDSAGVWGIESDSPEYHREVFAEEKSELLRQLKTLGSSVVAADFLER